MAVLLLSISASSYAYYQTRYNIDVVNQPDVRHFNAANPYHFILDAKNNRDPKPAVILFNHNNNLVPATTINNRVLNSFQNELVRPASPKGFASKIKHYFPS